MYFFLLCLAVNLVHGKKTGHQTYYDILMHAVTETCLHLSSSARIALFKQLWTLCCFGFLFVFGDRVSLAGLELISLAGLGLISNLWKPACLCL